MSTLFHYFPASIWTLAGIIGFTVRLLLFTKYYTDLLFVRQSGIGPTAEAIARREIDSCFIHLIIKSGIIAIGLMALIQRPASGAAEGTDVAYSAVVTLVLVGIPWLLVFDSLREYRHQLRMLNIRVDVPFFITKRSSHMPNVVLLNESTILTDDQVQKALPSFQKQVTNDFAPLWGQDAQLSFCPKNQPPPVGSWWVVILDDTDQADALGYHDVTNEGLPISKIFAKTDQQYNLSWTVTTSHEILEMLGDPYINQTAAVVGQGSSLRLYAFEACDACEADSLGYDIDGVTVSDFVTKQWFVPGEPGPFDFKQHINSPLVLLGGGYIGYIDVSSNTGWQQLTAGQPRHAQEEGHRFERRSRGLSKWQLSRRVF